MDDRFKFRTPIFSIENEFCGFQYSEIKGNRLKITGYSGIVEINEFLNFGKIEQCTGLKDKNGKLIYEGDIISLFAGTQEEVVKWCEERGGYFVDVRLSAESDWGPECLGNLQSTIEIIGNIHENPELLEEL